MKERTYPVTREFVKACLPARRADGHKGDFGKVLAVGGSVGFTGAPYLTAAAAVRSGCGLVYLGVPESIWPTEAAKCVSAMPFPLPDKAGGLSTRALPRLRERLGSCDVLALGPGLGQSRGTAEVVRALLAETEKPVVLDADGINALAGHIDVLDARRGRVTILTPHDGEFSHLTGLSAEELAGAERSEIARAFAAEHGCTLVLKGHRTLIAAAAGAVLENATGNSGLAKGGSGDVLTGMIASLLAQGAPEVWAAACAVWLHGRAADLAAQQLTPYAMAPQDVVDWLPAAFLEALEDRELV